MLKIAVFISGSGTNLQSIIDNCESGKVDAEIVLVLSNEPDAYGIERSKKHDIPSVVINHRDYSSRKEFEDAILESIGGYEIDLICLAGFMRVLTDNFLGRFPNRVINIHPALLPSFAGTQGQQDAFDYGAKFAGCTVHFVDAGVDTGPIIIQAVVPLKQGDTVETLKKRILAQEHKVYPQAIQYIAKGAAEIVGRKVVIKDLGEIEDFAEINPPASIFDA